MTETPKNEVIKITIDIAQRLVDGVLAELPPYSWWRGVEPSPAGGYFLLLCEDKSDPRKTARVDVTHDRVVLGLATLAEKHPRAFSDLQRDRWDTNTTDLLLQMIAYGDEVFA